jgi:hypothetical protein
MALLKIRQPMPAAFTKKSLVTPRRIIVLSELALLAACFVLGEPDQEVM